MKAKCITVVGRVCKIRALAVVLGAIGISGNAHANEQLINGMFGMIVNGIQQGMQNQQNRMVPPQAGYQAAVDPEAEKRAQRAEIQHRLNRLGYDAGAPDGAFGGQTREAIKAFQRSLGAEPTGKITESQVAALYQRSGGMIATDVPTSPSDGAGAGGPQASQAFVEPATPIAIAPPANAAPAGAQAWVEPQAPMASPAQQDPAAAATPATSSIGAMIDDAVCGGDTSLLNSIKSLVAAGAAEKSYVATKTYDALEACTETKYVSVDFLLEMTDRKTDIPLWILARRYEHGNPSDPFFSKTYLVAKDYRRLLVYVNFAQFRILGNRSISVDDAQAMEVVRADVNKRDCLGQPLLYHAIQQRNHALIGFLLDNGANPNLPVPYMTGEPGVTEDAIGALSDVRRNVNGTSYGLRPSHACINNGPSAAMMQGFQARNELVPVWVFGLRQAGAGISIGDVKRMIEKVPNVPPATIRDAIETGQWRLNLNDQTSLELVELLVARGADINAPTRKGQRPITLWMNQGLQPASLQKLLTMGARI